MKTYSDNIVDTNKLDIAVADVKTQVEHSHHKHAIVMYVLVLQLAFDIIAGIKLFF
jgi:hypothetical protein